MAFDQTTRGRLQKLVNSCRSLLSDEFSIQLRQIYGLDPSSGEVTPIARLTHLDDRERHVAEILRETLAHYLGADADNQDNRTTIIDRIVREQAFTVLNRLAALLMMEARGQLIESVSKGYQSRGYQLYSKIAGTALGETGHGYQTYLYSLFDEFALELPALFSRFAANGLLFPRETALRALLDELNHFEIEPLWAEDETIGWIYQYFNSKEERKAMRDASQAPRNSRELAVRNQFFTPRYVVEFLVDNTLGRLWFNATGGKSALAGRCQYLLIKPDEHPEPAIRLRDPRTLKLLDPACGSMHFGLYAFDLFAEIYQEAWAWEQEHGPGSLDVSTQPQSGFKPLSQTYEDEAAYLRDVPRLIIEHNIYGVDIDPRAAQIAALALWLRAQRAWHQAELKAKERPFIGRGNVVAAIAPPAERELRQLFAASLDRRDTELFEKTLQLLKGLPELGVLLQVERELPSLIRQVFGEHGQLFKAADFEQWQKAEARLRVALTEFAQAAKSTYQGRLFAQDALEGLRLIDLCREEFDVVVMNPPFGEVAEGSRRYIEESYGASSVDIYCQFIARARQLLGPHGLIGVICPRSFLYYIDFFPFREAEIFNGAPLITSIELGFGVLDDATVRTSISIFSNENVENSTTTFANLTTSNSKDSLLLQLVSMHRDGSSPLDARSISEFKGLPGKPILLSLSKGFVSYLADAKKLDPIAGKFHSGERAGAATIVNGLQTNDDYRFIRVAHEVIPSSLNSKWHALFKSTAYSPYEAPTQLVVNWMDKGSEIKAFIELGGNSASRYVSGEEHYPTGGAWFPGICERGNGVAVARFEAIPSRRGLVAIPRGELSPSFLCGVMNSVVGTGVVGMIMPDRYRNPTYVGMIPIPNEDIKANVEEVVTQIRVIIRNHISDETNFDYSGPPPLILNSNPVGFDAVYSSYERKVRSDLSRLSDLEQELDRLVIEGLPITSSDVRELEGFSNRPPIKNWALKTATDKTVVASELLQYFFGLAFGYWKKIEDINASELQDGSAFPRQPIAAIGLDNSQFPDILVEDLQGADDLCQGLSKIIETFFEDNSGKAEAEICNALGFKSLRSFLRAPNGFFDFHLKAYSKNRRPSPVYWPISFNSDRYTLWIHYRSINHQTLYSAINDFVEPKLRQVRTDIIALRDKASARSRDEEKQFEMRQAFELELTELLDTLLKLAPTYKPNHDDGVQISAAPLWQLFRHKPWQKVLKDTWAKLEKGDYDWAHLAMNYWPDRVREKCKSDKSLAIAHGLEDLYVEPKAAPKKTRKKKSGADE